MHVLLLGILFLYILKSKRFDLLATNFLKMCLLWNIAISDVFIRPHTMCVMSKTPSLPHVMRQLALVNSARNMTQDLSDDAWAASLRK